MKPIINVNIGIIIIIVVRFGTWVMWGVGWVAMMYWKRGRRSSLRRVDSLNKFLRIINNAGITALGKSVSYYQVL